MIALSGIAIQSKIYESSASLVYRGIREQDGRAIVVKVLKPDHPAPQELTRYRQEYEITRSLNLAGVIKTYGQQDCQRKEKMKQWAQYALMNPLYKYHLVEAKKARILGQLLEAEEFYEQAIQGARDNEYLQEEALVYELAAKFYLVRDRKKFAQFYMKEAHYGEHTKADDDALQHSVLNCWKMVACGLPLSHLFRLCKPQPKPA